MKTALLGCLCLILGVGTARADLTVVQTVEGLGQQTENTAKFKGGKTRVDTSPGTSLVMDLKTGEIINLMHGPKTYLKVASALTQAAIASIRPEPAPGDPAAAQPKLTPTGKSETIGGWASEEYVGNVAGVKMTLWLTRALPDYQAALKDMGGALSQGPMGPLMQSYGLDLTSLPGFPMRTVLEVAPGQTMTRTVTSISTKPLPDADFEVPPGYREIAVPTLTPPAAEQPVSSPAH